MGTESERGYGPATQPGDLLRDLVGRRVAVWSMGSQADPRDEGLLEAFDGAVFVLRTAGGDRLYFSLYGCRLIKPLDGADR